MSMAPYADNPGALGALLGLALCSLALLGLAAFSLLRRRQPGVWSFALILLGFALWSLCYIAVLLATDLPTKLFWWQWQMVGIVSIPANSVLFAFQFSRPQEKTSRKLVALLCVEPLVALALVFSNDAHHLMLSSAWVAWSGPWLALENTFGPAMIVHTAYAFSLELIAAQIMLLAAMRSGPLVRRQATVLLLGGLVLLVSEGYWRAHPQDLGIDPTPFLFVVFALAGVWALARLHVLDVLPIARDEAFRAMADAVLVLDRTHRVVDGNPAAWSLLGLSAETAAGCSWESLLPGRTDPVAWTDLQEADHGEVSITVDAQDRTFEVRSSPLGADRAGFPVGHLALLRDVTDLRHAERDLHRTNRRLAEEVTARERDLDRKGVVLQAARNAALQADTTSLLRELLQSAVDALQADGATVCRWDATRDAFVVVSDTDEPDGGAERLIYVGEGALGLAALQRAPVVVGPSAAADAASLLCSPTQVAAIPLLHDGNLLGVVEIRSHHPDRTFSADDVEMLEMLAATTAGALIARERDRLAGVLLAARTAQHELNNRLSLTLGYAELLTTDPTLSDRTRSYAEEARRGAAEAGDVIKRLARLTRLEEARWDSDESSTLRVDGR